MFITDQTIGQLRAATVMQIRTRLKNEIDLLSKKQLIELIFERSGEFSDTPVLTRRADGQLSGYVQTSRDALGMKLGSRLISNSYYATGEVDVIKIETLDASDTVVRTKTIKHYKDGRQPTVTEI